MSKDTFYFKHDLNAAEDPELILAMMKGGMAAYGIWWRVVEMIYAQGGRIPANFDMLAFKLRVSVDDIKNVVRAPLFTIRSGWIISERATREINARESARNEGKNHIERRLRKDGTPWVRGKGSDRDPSRVPSRGANSTLIPGEERRGDREDITTANGAPSAVDFSEVRLPKGMGAYGGAYVRNVPADECQFIIRTMRPGASVKAALEWRIKLKREESEGRANDGFKKPDGEKP